MLSVLSLRSMCSMLRVLGCGRKEVGTARFRPVRRGAAAAQRWSRLRPLACVHYAVPRLRQCWLDAVAGAWCGSVLLLRPLCADCLQIDPRRIRTASWQCWLDALLICLDPGGAAAVAAARTRSHACLLQPAAQARLVGRSRASVCAGYACPCFCACTVCVPCTHCATCACASFRVLLWFAMRQALLAVLFQEAQQRNRVRSGVGGLCGAV